MASALQLSNVLIRLAPPALLLLSLILQAAMAPPPPPPDFLSLCLQGICSAIDHLQHLLQSQLVGFLRLSPCPIFILANFIVFTLLFKSCYPSSSSNSTLVGSDHAPPQLTDTHGHDLFFAVAGWDQSGPHADYYHVLSFSNYIHDQEPCVEYTNNWIYLQQPQKVEAQAKLSSEGDLCMKGSQKEARLVTTPTTNTGSKTFETQALNEQLVPRRRVVDTQQKAQAVVINMEPHRLSRTNTPALQNNHSLSEQSLCEAKAAEQNTKGKIKDMGVANLGVREGLKDAKEVGAAKPAEKDKRVKAADEAPHATTRPTISGKCCSEGATSIPTNQSMQRTRLSIKISPSPRSFQPISLPTSPLDGLSDDEANKRFSDFIASRLAHMKNESLL